jgi:predicted transcriptional regulator
MTEKGLLKRTPQGRAFRYRAAQKREKTLTSFIGDMVTRVFGGSPSALVAHLLEHSNASPEELAAIRKLIGERKRLHGGGP